MALRANSSRNKAGSASLGHVVVCGGTTHEWFECSANEWQRQLNVIVQSLEGSGVQWLTLCPWGGQFEGDSCAPVAVARAHGLVAQEETVTRSSDDTVEGQRYVIMHRVTVTRPLSLRLVAFVTR